MLSKVQKQNTATKAVAATRLWYLLTDENGVESELVARSDALRNAGKFVPAEIFRIHSAEQVSGTSLLLKGTLDSSKPTKNIKLKEMELHYEKIDFSKTVVPGLKKTSLPELVEKIKEYIEEKKGPASTKSSTAYHDAFVSLEKWENNSPLLDYMLIAGGPSSTPAAWTKILKSLLSENCSRFVNLPIDLNAFPGEFNAVIWEKFIEGGHGYKLRGPVALTGPLFRKYAGTMATCSVFPSRRERTTRLANLFEDNPEKYHAASSDFAVIGLSNDLRKESGDLLTTMNAADIIRVVLPNWRTCPVKPILLFGADSIDARLSLDETFHDISIYFVFLDDDEFDTHASVMALALHRHLYGPCAIPYSTKLDLLETFLTVEKNEFIKLAPAQQLGIALVDALPLMEIKNADYNRSKESRFIVNTGISKPLRKLLDSGVAVSPSWLVYLVRKKMPASFVLNALARVVELLSDDESVEMDQGSRDRIDEGLEWDLPASYSLTPTSDDRITIEMLKEPTDRLNPNSLAVTTAINAALVTWLKMAILVSHSFMILPSLTMTWMKSFDDTCNVDDPIRVIENEFTQDKSLLLEAVPDPVKLPAYGPLLRLTKSAAICTSTFYKFHLTVCDAVNHKSFKPAFEIESLTRFLLDLKDSSGEHHIVALPKKGLKNQGQYVLLSDEEAAAEDPKQHRVEHLRLGSDHGLMYTAHKSFKVACFYGPTSNLAKHRDRLLAALNMNHSTDGRIVSIIRRPETAPGGNGAAIKLRALTVGDEKIFIAHSAYVTEERCIHLDDNNKVLIGADGPDGPYTGTRESIYAYLQSKFNIIASHSQLPVHLVVYGALDPELITLARDATFVSITQTIGNMPTREFVLGLQPEDARTELNELDEELGIGREQSDDSMEVDGQVESPSTRRSAAARLAPRNATATRKTMQRSINHPQQNNKFKKSSQASNSEPELGEPDAEQ